MTNPCYESYRGYSGSAEYSEEDKCYFGKILYIPDLIIYEADSLEGLFAAFCEAVDDYLDSAKEEGRIVHAPCSGTLNVRLGKETHTELAILAHSKGVSINKIIKQACDDYLRRSKTQIYNFGLISPVSSIYKNNYHTINKKQVGTLISEVSYE